MDDVWDAYGVGPKQKVERIHCHQAVIESLSFPKDWRPISALNFPPYSAKGTGPCLLVGFNIDPVYFAFDSKLFSFYVLTQENSKYQIDHQKKLMFSQDEPINSKTVGHLFFLSSVSPPHTSCVGTLRQPDIESISI